jgi:MFS family permease
MARTLSCATAEVEEPARSDSSTGVTLAILAIGVLAFGLLQSLVLPALSTIQRELRTSESGAAWIVSGYLLSASVATPIVGRLGDVYGKRRALVATLALLALGTLIAAMATSLAALVAARVVQGVGGGLFPLAFGIVRDQFPRERVPGALGIVSALLGLGAAIGVVLAGVIVSGLGYHWLFWLPLGGVLFALLAAMRFVPESPERAPAGINWAGAALMSVGLAAVLLAISQTSSWGWGSTRTIAVAAGGLLVLALWVRSELRSESPLVDMRMMAVRGVWTTNLLTLLLGVGMVSAFVLVPQFAETDPANGFGFGASVVEGGTFLVPLSLAMLAFGAAAGAVERRFGSKASVVTGVALTLAAFVLLLAAHDGEAPVYGASAVAGAGIGLCFAAVANLIVESVRFDQTGVATGMNTVARSVGSAFGGQLSATFLAGSVAAGLGPTEAGFDHGFVLAIVALAAALAVGVMIPSRRRPDRPPVHDPAASRASAAIEAP